MIKPNFKHKLNKKELAIAIAQDYKTNQILMTAFIDEEAYNKSIQTKHAHYYSTSRNKVWYKGETSGHIQEIKEILYDCDEDAIIFKVKQKGGACHTGHYSCFYKRLNNDKLEEIEEKIFDADEVYKQ